MYNSLKKIIVLIIVLVSISYTKLSAQKAHPYLFYTNERVQFLKNRIKTDTAIANSWNNINRNADQMMANGKGGDVEMLTLAYRVTGDKKYAERVKALLAALLQRDAWDGMDDRMPRWNSGLSTSHYSWTASVAFDGIYDYLTKDERARFAQRIVDLGIKPSIGDWISDDVRIHSLNSMGHNWWSAVVFEAGTASLAVMNEIPEAKSWAEEIMRASKEWFAFSGSVLENKPASFDPAGGFYESINYANYGVSEYLLFRLAYTNAVNKISMPYDTLLQKTVDWFINACYPRSGVQQTMSLNFGDGSNFANGDKPAKLLIALGLGKENYYWYVKQTSKNQFREDFNKATPMGILYEPESKPVQAVPTMPVSALYASMGWGMLRSSWKPDATLLGIKSGFTWNHAHADAGSFVLYHNGQYLLIDGGDVSYGQPEYSDYFVQSQAHNVMLFNGVAQDPQDEYHAVKAPGHLYDMIDGGFLKYILADVTGPTSRNFLRNYRNFLWIGNVILIIDDVKTYQSGKFEFLLHYQDSAVQKGPDLEITNNNASILFRPLFPETLPLGYPHDFPEKMKLGIRTGIKDRNANEKINYYAISPAEDSKQMKFINAIILLDSSNKSIKTFIGSSGASGAAARINIPVIEKIEGVNWIGLRITQAGKVTEVYVNLLADGRLMHRNANNVINGWETDAYISTVTFPEKADRNNPDNISSYFMSNGSYLRKDGKTLLSSLSKVFTYVENDKDKLKVQLQGQPLMHVLLGVPKPQKLMLNNQPASIQYKNKMLVIDRDDTK